MDDALKPESWYVQRMIDVLRVPHGMTPDMNYSTALLEFGNFASVVEDAYAEISMTETKFSSPPPKLLTVSSVGEHVAQLDSSRVNLEASIRFIRPELNTLVPTLTITS